MRIVSDRPAAPPGRDRPGAPPRGRAPRRASILLAFGCVAASGDSGPRATGDAPFLIRLARSACFQASQMTGLTCHPPHIPRDEVPADHDRNRCVDCHGGATPVPVERVEVKAMGMAVPPVVTAGRQAERSGSETEADPMTVDARLSLARALLEQIGG